MKFNEEAVKNNVIIPFLQQIGLGPNELEFEKNFTIQLGRGVYNVKGEKSKEANGRLDILCKRDGKNLFVIELKAEGIELTEDDKNQGISYARLLSQMAPYVLLSSGDKSILYETITGEEVETLNQDYITDGFIPTLDEELSLRFEALKNFVGYSYENILNFCKINNQEILKKFCAEPLDEASEQIQKKYVPSLYVKRKRLEDCFKEFLKQNNQCVFAVVGESGVGKTNTICHLLETINNEPILFFSGSTLGNSFLKELAADFNLAFSAQESEINILKKVSTLAERFHKSFIVFFDAIDEWSAEDKVAQINQLVKYFKRLNIRLCISCKDFIWDSFLMYHSISTDLYDNLYPGIPKLTDFDTCEVNEAVNKYTRFLDIESNSTEDFLDLQNPFNLRVAFEVAYNDKVPLSISRDSRATLRRYIDLKLEKTSSFSINLRFLEQISKCLLKYRKIQILEDEIRKELNLNIYDEIPEELFSFNFIYKYVEENGRTCIGFYFSGIRDYIVAIQILKLEKAEGSPRIKKIIEALSNFIGENAVMYFFKTGTAKEQEDCIKAAIEFDREYQKSLLSKLLSWQGSNLRDEAKRSTNSIVIEHLKFIFERYRDKPIIAEQVIDVFERLEASIEVEIALVYLFTIILKYPQDIFSMVSSFSRVSYRIAGLLKSYDSKECTEKLVQHVLNQNNDGYVRRYIIESLSNRTIDGKKELFLKLVIDSNPDVRTWISSWYNKLEDNILRDKLLEILDTTNKNYEVVAIARTLSNSAIEDTGEKLFYRFLNKKYDEEVTCWLCRAIADLNYRKAIPKFIEILKEKPYSELAEHILIGLGDLKATDAMSTLLELIPKSKDKTGIFWTWLSYAFSNIASEKDYQMLVKIILENDDNINAICFSAQTLAKTRNKDYNQIICKIIMDESLGLDQRLNILKEWESSLTSELIDGINVSKINNNLAISMEELNALYTILDQKNKMSPIALGLLMNFEPEINKLYQKIIQTLPNLNHNFSTRIVHLINSTNIENLAHLMKPWLNQQFFRKNSNHFFVHNCMQFAGILGDITTLEAISTNKEKLANSLDDIYIDYIEHTIRSSNGKIRLMLH
ncbi:MAG: type I restriction enzyme HsdR N-terminal domain-containing protein [Candidatus Methanoperedens sp.]|nr:type I restriction enzyme HsdR N-terminal domain-containing protein [Candidatus Methanoperedens sp.]